MFKTKYRCYVKNMHEFNHCVFVYVEKKTYLLGWMQVGHVVIDPKPKTVEQALSIGADIFTKSQQKKEFTL